MRAARFLSRAGLATAVAAAVAAVAAAPGFGDGDPCSDVLLNVDVCIPVAPTAPPYTTLLQRVQQVNRGGYRLKVAVIATPSDLGSVPSLFGQPTGYAKFLGLELSQLYRGNLMILMPAGIGFYHGGRDVTAEDAALQGLVVDGSTAAGLTSTAVNAVTAVAAAVGPPIGAVESASRHGRRLTVVYRAIVRPTAPRVVVRVSARVGSKTVAKRSAAFTGASRAGPRALVLAVPAAAPAKGLRACVQVVDGSRASLLSCLPVR